VFKALVKGKREGNGKENATPPVLWGGTAKGRKQKTMGKPKDMADGTDMILASDSPEGQNNSKAGEKGGNPNFTTGTRMEGTGNIWIRQSEDGKQVTQRGGSFRLE